jgi:hypothetical protein
VDAADSEITQIRARAISFGFNLRWRSTTGGALVAQPEGEKDDSKDQV